LGMNRATWAALWRDLELKMEHVLGTSRVTWASAGEHLSGVPAASGSAFRGLRRRSASSCGHAPAGAGEPTATTIRKRSSEKDTGVGAASTAGLAGGQCVEREAQQAIYRGNDVIRECAGAAAAPSGLLCGIWDHGDPGWQKAPAPGYQAFALSRALICSRELGRRGRRRGEKNFRRVPPTS